MILNGLQITIGSVYGPNIVNQHSNFYHNIQSKIDSPNFVIGGDHNTVGDLNPVNLNIDLANYANFPNKIHSKAINHFINQGFWVDPFRTLHPESVDFSWVPFSKAKKNRARLDFFLTNVELLRVIQDCKISHRRNKMFDHRPIHLSFKSPMVNKTSKIDNTLLDLVELDLTAKLTTYETTLQYCRTPPPLVSETIEQSFILINQLHVTIDYNNSLPSPDKLISNIIQFNIQSIGNALDYSSTLNDLQDLPLTIPPDLFFQTLMNNISIAILGRQKSYRSARSRRINDLLKSIDISKKNRDLKTTEDLENNLTEIETGRTMKILQELPIWHILEGERISKTFCDLAKGAKNNESLNIIEGPGGKIFNSVAERSQYISRYYQDIYKFTEQTGTLEEFLGPEILNSDCVNDSKLNEAEKLSLDAEITLEEMDNVIKSRKKGTSPGPDGWTYQGLRKIWEFIRVPLLQSFKHMTTKGTLSLNLSLCNLRLIPKKGDLTQLTNWRPISLLNTSYKIISSVITNRLMSVVDKIVGPKQKAYSKKKNIHFALLNVLNLISQSNELGSNNALVLCDFSKAFDKISHKFILQCLKFFNFGPNFVQMIKTILTGRRGGVLIDGKCHTTFQFLSGSGQGDPPSPILFIIGLALIHFKFNQDHVLEKINLNLPPPLEAGNLADAYADDFTAGIPATRHNITRLLGIFEKFKGISGLSLNVKKSIVVPLGAAKANLDFLNYIRNETEFLLEDNFKLLGFQIDNNLSLLDQNFLNAHRKILNIAQFWSRFKLSVFGRVNVAKCYMLSQISYWGSVINPSVGTMRLIESTIHNFIRGDLTISEARITGPYGSTGLNFPKLSDFIQGLRINIFKKSLESDDQWAAPIKRAVRNPVIPYIVNAGCPLLNFFPFSKAIVDSLQSYLKNFYQQGSNYQTMPIFDNLFVNQIARDVYNPNTNIFRVNSVAKHSIPANIIVNFPEGSHSSKASIEAYLGSEISIVEVFRIRAIGQKIINFHHSRPENEREIPPRPFTKLLFSKTKGSKKYRLAITKDVPNNFAENRLEKNDLRMENNYIPFNIAFNRLLGVSGLSHLVRSSLLKYLSNTLGVLARVGHFQDDIDERCSFCRLTPYLTPPRETANHIFTQCESLTHIHDFVLDILVCPESSNLSILIGSLSINSVDNLLDNLLITIYIHFIYTNRLNSKIPSLEKFKTFLGSAIETCALSSRKIAIQLTNGIKNRRNNFFSTISLERVEKTFNL